MIGNVPFADLKLDYQGQKLSLHDYFFAKSIDALKPGGVLALVTTHYTLDKQNAALRERLGGAADFLGAIRLPSDAFKREGTAVVTDINPKYYEAMSDLLDALIQQRREEAIDYQAYLSKVVDLTKKIKKPSETSSYPASISSETKRSLYDNLDKNESLAVAIDTAVRRTKKDDWKNNPFKKREVRNAISQELGHDEALTERVFELVLNQREY